MSIEEGRKFARGNVVKTYNYAEWKRVVNEAVRNGYVILFARYYHNIGQGIVVLEKMYE